MITNQEAKDRFIGARYVVLEQAKDDRLWCEPGNIVEHGLQQALRRLHAAIEGDAELVALMDPGLND